MHSFWSQTNDVGDVLVGWGLFLVCALPPRHIPNFKTPPSADKSDLAFQPDFAAQVFRQNEATLLVGDTVLGAGMQLPQEDSAFACGDSVVIFGDGAHAGEFLRGHDEEEVILGIGKEDEFLSSFPAPAGRDGDAIFFVDGVTELTGVKGLS
ncbi:MAG TPA: hypothetical protein VFJ55_01380 [Chthoniobacterales bacterium]|nr:hypothetical protein [Chthoniobacterales bacterium]